QVERSAQEAAVPGAAGNPRARAQPELEARPAPTRRRLRGQGKAVAPQRRRRPRHRARANLPLQVADAAVESSSTLGSREPASRPSPPSSSCWLPAAAGAALDLDFAIERDRRRLRTARLQPSLIAANHASPTAVSTSSVTSGLSTTALAAPNE